MKRFLTAEWRDLIMANYEVETSLLEPLLPIGTVLDLHEGRCFVSLVAFMFLNTRVMGFRVPFHVNFEEVNLRFYVKRITNGEVRRGAVFIKEIVPRIAIAAVARIVYGEPYERWKMANNRNSSGVGYNWIKPGCRNSLSASGVKILVFQAPNRKASLLLNITGVIPDAARPRPMGTAWNIQNGSLQPPKI